MELFTSPQYHGQIKEKVLIRRSFPTRACRNRTLFWFQMDLRSLPMAFKYSPVRMSCCFSGTRGAGGGSPLERPTTSPGRG